ncbi:transposase [Rhizobium sp. YIM 134829]|uniref:transposase n=1 Tax=Rhizobium sp. YIM 134829 TaxID=3390453 RepID=UPI0039785920
MTATASKLDTEKFRKVHALMKEGATEGERAAARSRAEAIAKGAGLTLAQAVSKLSGQPEPKKAGFFDGFDDWMEEREPGYKAKQARERSEREMKRQARCRELLAEYGSEDAVFADTKQEELLRAALHPLADRSRFSNSHETYVSGYAGWQSGNPPPVVWGALQRAYPLPTEVTAVWAEYLAWEKLRDDRSAFEPHYDAPIWIYARQAALEHLLDTMPALDFQGYAARLEWMSHLNYYGRSRGDEKDAILIAVLRSDLSRLSGSVQARCAQSEHRTTADKAAAIRSMLRADPNLSNREVARRLGVSPQTVGTWRKKMRGAAHG